MPSTSVIPPPYFYCTQQDMENILSAVGLLTVIDDLRNGALTADEQQMVTDAMTDATCTIDYYVGMKYAPAMLATSPFVDRCAAVMACYALRKHGGQPVPESLQEWALECEEKLKAVDQGKVLPGVPLRRVLAPAWSFTRLDMRNQFRVIRVEIQNSSQKPATSLPQNTDYQELYTPDLR